MQVKVVFCEYSGNQPRKYKEIPPRGGTEGVVCSPFVFKINRLNLHLRD